MASKQKRIFFILLCVSIIYFVVFIPANNTGAKDQMMISLFETDEFAQYPIALRMVEPADSIKQNLINFFIYGHYYYGWPFYASSALVTLAGTLIQGYNNTQFNMLLLRQVISILPMLAALQLLVYVQTKFRSYKKSIGLFVLLLSVSAVVENNLWWHVDSLAVFFIALVIFFLDKDDLRFGRDFYLAAASTGLATGTKVIGLFFFLGIPACLLLGIFQKQLTWRTAAVRAAAFVGIMAAAILISNPFLIYRSQFNKMIGILSMQAASQTSGWVLTYAKGPASWLPIINELYGQLIFIVLAFIALAVGIWRKESRTRSLVIALWSLPFGLYVLYAIAIKPTHFFLPILLPVYSSLIILFDISPFANKKNSFAWLRSGLVLAVIGYQAFIYINKDIEIYRSVLTREDREESIVFYHTIESNVLSRIPADVQLEILRDVRMYFPDSTRWTIHTYWKGRYSTVEETQPDMILLWTQRIVDYTQAGAQASAVNPVDFQDIYQFYVDADNDQLRGYRLIYRNGEGLLFAKDELYEEYLK